jgi:hypothetical protein
MSPGFGQQPRFVVTIQPVGTLFNPPAQLTLPNVDGLAPRAMTEMYSYDHDLAAFVSIGTGTVSEDGAVIVSDPGVGVIKAGWHCGGNPNPTGSAGTCPTCQRCQGTQCVPDTALNGQPAVGEKCKNCQNGTPTPRFTDAQCCATVNSTGGYVVCCNGEKLACVGNSFPAGDAGDNIIRACVFEHERAHYAHIVCPTGAAECDTSRPGFSGITQADGECEAAIAEVACLNNADCGGDATCEADVVAGIASARAYGNGFKDDCIP